jgi:hypothetical protein
MSNQPLVRKLFDAMGRKLSRKASRHIEDVCRERNLPVNTWFRWWLEERPVTDTYDNIVLSQKTDGDFDQWLAGERMYAPARVSAQLEELKLHLKDAVLPPGEALRRPIRGVGPLVHFTIGKYLEHSPDVEWIRDEAVDELSAKPWLSGVLARYREFLPEPEYINIEDTGSEDQWRQGKRRTTWWRQS